MNIAVQGTKLFSDYTVFLRAMSVAMSDAKGKEISVFSVGPVRTNAMVAEFCNKAEGSLKVRGIKIKFVLVPESEVEKRIKDMNYFILLSAPNERITRLAILADKAKVEVGHFRY